MNADQNENKDKHNTHSRDLIVLFFRSALIRVNPRLNDFAFPPLCLRIFVVKSR